MAAAADSVPALAPEVMKRVEYLQEQERKLVEDYDKERAALEAKFQDMRSAMFKDREEVLSGAKDPAEGAGATKGIPDFWVKAMENFAEYLGAAGEDDDEEDDDEEEGGKASGAGLITKKDLEVLKHLTNITLELKGDWPYDEAQLSFHFSPNEFFEDAVLTKTLKGSELADEEGADIETLEGCTIHWKAGKDLTVEEKKVKQKVGSGKNKRTVTVNKKMPVPSFFRFFETPDMSKLQEQPGDEDEEKEMMEIYQAFQQQASTFFAVKDKLLPDAVSFFTGEALEEEEDEDEEEGMDDIDEEEEEEESEEEEKPKKKGGKKGGKKAADEDEGAEGEDGEALAKAFKKSAKTDDAAPEGSEQAPECKQQ